MPHIKIARKSTDTDMTPFVDIAFLILSFFIMATKFKPPEPVEIQTPNSVSADILKEENAMLITIDGKNRVFLNVSSPKDGALIDQMIQGISTSRNLNLTPAQIANFRRSPIIGVPFNQLGGLLNLDPADQNPERQPGIPVLDSLNNEMVWWISEAKKAFAGKKLNYLIKGDNGSKYPTFEAVINALKRNEEFKFNLVTSQEGAPEGTELYIERRRGGKK